MVILSPAAEDDLVGIASEIAEHRSQVSLRWTLRIRETFDMLAEHPEVGEVREGFGVPGCRSFTFGNYVIFFRAVSSGIEIARVVHGYRDLRNL